MPDVQEPKSSRLARDRAGRAERHCRADLEDGRTAIRLAGGCLGGSGVLLLVAMEAETPWVVELAGAVGSGLALAVFTSLIVGTFYTARGLIRSARGGSPRLSASLEGPAEPDGGDERGGEHNDGPLRSRRSPRDVVQNEDHGREQPESYL